MLNKHLLTDSTPTGREGSGEGLFCDMNGAGRRLDGTVAMISKPLGSDIRLI